MVESTSQGAASPGPPRLSLARVSKGRIEHAIWVHAYGPEGVGKSSFGAGAPRPIVIDVESGTKDLDVERFEFDDSHRTTPEGFEEIMEALRTVERDPGPYRSVVLDTLDAVEALIWRFVCERDGKENIAAYGYGKGENIVALDEWRRLVALLERVRARGVNVITLSHSVVRRFDDPESDGWDRYTLKLHEKASGLVKERADAVLFANFETVLKKKGADGPAKKFRALTTNTRWLHTMRTGGYDAKNRNSLPEQVPLDWGELGAEFATSALVEEVKSRAKGLGPDDRAKVLDPGGFLESVGRDVMKLTKLTGWIIQQQTQATTESGS